MPSARLLLLLLGAALTAVVGALFGSPWATGAGGGLVLGLLAVHPAVTDRAVPRATRLLLRVGLLLVTLTVVVEVWGWTATPVDAATLSTGELIALVHDPARQQAIFLRQAAVAGGLLLACACLGAAVGRPPVARLRRFGPATLQVAPSTVVVLTLVALLPSGLTALLGSFTNVAVAVLLVSGAYAWIVGRAVRRHGIASIAVVGATVLATAAWVAVDDALRSRPEPRDSNTFYEAGVGVAVAADAGLDVEAAVAVAALLLGTALTVLASARLSTAGGTR